ncbi:MAG: hypothetical protein AAFZ18_24230 [Myxococcota bacterium]
MKPSAFVAPALCLGLAVLGGGCQLIVDTDPESVVPPDAGPDAEVLDLETPRDVGDGDPNACAVDLDCTSRSGPRFRCGGDNTCFDLDEPCQGPPVRVSQDIVTDQTWYADTCYELAGTIFVRDNAMLTIREGTLVTGLADRAALIVTRTGRIMVSGTATDPVVMTSAEPAGRRQPGDWGGLALLGRAPINAVGGEAFLEGLTESDNSAYGGSDPEYSCGTLEYLRVEFAGFELSNNKELNGLTLGGCGMDTKIEHVQVHYGSDDGIEVFGGSVGLQWIVISRAQDDSLDWDLGWLGWAQYVAILMDEPRPDLDVNIFTGGDNGIEADSSSDETAGIPRSRPRLYNFTMLGSRRDGSRTRGMLLRRGTSAEMRNFLVGGFSNGLWDIGDELTSDCMRTPLGSTCTASSAFALDGLVLWDMGADGTTWVEAETDDDDGGFDEAAFITGSSSPRQILGTDPALVQPDLNGVFDIDLRPIASSPTNLEGNGVALVPYSDPPEQVQPQGHRYVGAFEPSGVDWMEGWTAFPEN